MPATVRHIRRLRLVAGTQAAARAAVTRLEDALRCASLPDTGARLLLVRRLALGDLGLDVDPGWLPWLGRVVTYHYGDAPQPTCASHALQQIAAQMPGSFTHAPIERNVRIEGAD